MDVNTVPKLSLDQCSRPSSIISQDLPYRYCLARFGLSTLNDRRNELCNKIFRTISEPSITLSSLLPSKYQARYNTRRKPAFIIPRIRTDLFRRTFIPALCIRADSWPWCSYLNFYDDTKVYTVLIYVYIHLYPLLWLFILLEFVLLFCKLRNSAFSLRSDFPINYLSQDLKKGSK